MKPLILTLSFLLFGLHSVAQTKRTRPAAPTRPLITTQTAITKDGRTVLLKSDGTWEYTNDPKIEPKVESTQTPVPTPAPTPERANLAIEAAIVYGMGGPQPVARNDFFLLDMDLAQVLREAGLKVGDYEKERQASLRRSMPNMPDFSRMSPQKPDTDANLISDYAFASKFPEHSIQFLNKALLSIKKHTIASATTDFSGKLELKDIAPGSYFMMGLTETRRGFAVWSTPITLKPGSNSLILDQRNAALAF